MSMGQAAGVAASESLRVDCGAREISIPQLREVLQRMGAVLEFPTSVADVAVEAWRKEQSS